MKARMNNMMTGYIPDNGTDKDKEDNQMYICTEIAAAESISGLNYETPKAK